MSHVVPLEKQKIGKQNKRKKEPLHVHTPTHPVLGLSISYSSALSKGN